MTMLDYTNSISYLVAKSKCKFTFKNSGQIKFKLVKVKLILSQNRSNQGFCLVWSIKIKGVISLHLQCKT